MHYYIFNLLIFQNCHVLKSNFPLHLYKPATRNTAVIFYPPDTGKLLQPGSEDNISHDYVLIRSQAGL